MIKLTVRLAVAVGLIFALAPAANAQTTIRFTGGQGGGNLAQVQWGRVATGATLVFRIPIRSGRSSTVTVVVKRTWCLMVKIAQSVRFRLSPLRPACESVAMVLGH